MPPPQDSVPPKPKIKPSGIVTPQSRFFKSQSRPPNCPARHSPQIRPTLLSIPPPAAINVQPTQVYDRVNSVELESERCKDVCLKHSAFELGLQHSLSCPPLLYMFSLHRYKIGLTVRNWRGSAAQIHMCLKILHFNQAYSTLYPSPRCYICLAYTGI